MKTILFIHHVGLLSGAGVMLQNIIQALDPRKFRAVVVCPPGELTAELQDLGAEVIHVPRRMHYFFHTSGFSRPIYSTYFLKEALLQRRDFDFWAQFIHDADPDLVQLNSLVLAPLAESARRASVPVVCLDQDTFARGLFGVRTAWIKRLLSNKMDAVVFISQYDCAQAQCRAPIVEVVPNWVDLTQFDRHYSRDKARNELGIPADAQMVFFTGGASKIKGTLPLLKALDHLRDMNRLLLCIAGYNVTWSTEGSTTLQRIHSNVHRWLRGDYGTAMKKFICDRGLESRVHFTGFLKDLVPWYAAADVVVFPATIPHQARPIIEAGAMAKPVVCADFACFKEFVKNEHNALTFTTSDPKSLALALKRILEDPQFAQRLGEANYQVTLQHHDQRVNAPKFAAIYERVLQNSNKQHAERFNAESKRRKV
jgi:glycosyltransferase involved in cell wall biosynthesis